METSSGYPGAESARYPKEAFIAEADGLCSDFQAKSKPIRNEIETIERSANPESPQNLVRLGEPLNESIAEAEANLESIRELDPPKADQATIERCWTRRRKATASAPKPAKALEEGRTSGFGKRAKQIEAAQQFGPKRSPKATASKCAARRPGPAAWRRIRDAGRDRHGAGAVEPQHSDILMPGANYGRSIVLARLFFFPGRGSGAGGSSRRVGRRSSAVGAPTRRGRRLPGSRSGACAGSGSARPAKRRRIRRRPDGKVATSGSSGRAIALIRRARPTRSGSPSKSRCQRSTRRGSRRCASWSVREQLPEEARQGVAVDIPGQLPPLEERLDLGVAKRILRSPSVPAQEPGGGLRRGSASPVP